LALRADTDGDVKDGCLSAASKALGLPDVRFNKRMWIKISWKRIATAFCTT